MLEDWHQHFSELADNVHEVLWLTDAANSEMLYVSPAYEQMFGRTCASLYADARDWLKAIHPEDRPRLVAFASSAPNVVRRERYRVVHDDGAIRTVDIKVFPVCDGDAVVRIAGVAEDVTEHLQLEEQVRQSQKLESLGLLAGGVAHDFNNILAVISANTSFLRESVSTTSPEREVLDEITHAVERATAMTRQLLAFSRRQAVAPVVLDLNAAVNDTRKMLRRMVGENVVIRTSLEPELGRVRIDAGYFVQIVMNLVVNARDAMPDGGTITVATRNIGRREVMLAVTDTGCGMAPEVRARVFEPLFTTKGLGKGTGLGLSVVQGIVEQAGGRIELDSEVGTGTTLRVFLPFLDAPADVRETSVSTAVRGSERLLVVDDDPHVRGSLARALRMRGYDVIEASNGPAALQLMFDGGQRIDLLVTDVVMPGMGGRELVETARRRRPTLPALYISGYTDDAIQHGSDVDQPRVPMLEKPFLGAALEQFVRQILDGRR